MQSPLRSPLNRKKYTSEPYVEFEKQKRERDEARLTPLEWVSNVLSIGNNISANTAENIMKMFRGEETDFFGGVVKSFTKDGQNSYRKVLWGDADDPEYKGLLGSGGANNFWKKAAGFAADALLDPTNFISFGPTQAAKAAAKEAAEMGILASVRDPNFVTKFLRDFSKDHFDDLMKAGKKDKAFEYLKSYSKTEDFSRRYNQLYRDALRETEGNMRTQLSSAFGGKVFNASDDLIVRSSDAWRNTYISNLEAQLKRVTDPAKASQIASKIDTLRNHADDFREAARRFVDENSTGVALASPNTYDTMLRKSPMAKRMLSDPETMKAFNYDDWKDPLRGLTGLGETSSKFFGAEVAPKVRGGFNNAMHQLDTVRDALSKTKVSKDGTTLGDAWWSVMNTGAVGKIRRLVGFSNPYEELLKIKERDMAERMTDSIERGVLKVRDTLKGFSDEDKFDYVTIRTLVERISKNARAQGSQLHVPTVDEVITRAQGLAQTGQPLDLKDISHKIIMTPEKAQALREIDVYVSKTMKSLRDTENNWARLGYGDTVDDAPGYLTFIPQPAGPKMQGVSTPRGSHRQPFMREKEMGIYGAMANNQDIIQKLFPGVKKEYVTDLMKENLTVINTNLDEIVASRVIQHQRFAKRVGIIESFKPFGINTQDIGMAANSVAQDAMDLTTLEGDEILKGLFFDGHVASIIDRTQSILANDPDIIDNFNRSKGFLSYWKTIVTGNPGFHIRNFVSNNVTGFQQHGFAWFNPVVQRDAAIASAVGLEGVDAAAKRFRMGVTDVNRIMQKDYNGETLEELTRFAKENGIISRTFGGRDTKEAVQDLLGTREMSPLDKFGRFSRNVGSEIESFSKMQSFLIGVQRTARDGDATTAVLQWAKDDTKKWFIDYESLTTFEREKMKAVFPFYTWLRRNIANQVGELVSLEHWGRMSITPKLMNAFRDETVDNDQYPQYLREDGAIPVGRNSVGDILFMNPSVPIQDLNKIPIRGGDTAMEAIGNSLSSLADTMMDSAHPVLRSVLSGFKHFVVEKGDQDGKKREINGPVEQIAYGIADGALRLLGQGGIGERTKSGGYKIDEDVVNIIQNLRPEISWLSRMMSAPAAVVDAITVDTDGILDRIAGQKTKEEQVRTLFQALSFYAGQRFTAINEEDEEYNRAQSIYYAGLDKKTRESRSLPGYETRSADHRKKMEKVYKRMRLL